MTRPASQPGREIPTCPGRVPLVFRPRSLRGDPGPAVSRGRRVFPLETPVSDADNEPYPPFVGVVVVIFVIVLIMNLWGWV